MLIRAVAWCAVWCTVLAQESNGNVSQPSGQWGWQVSRTGPDSVGHYFVKLPQSEQQVRYVADDSGYHGALAVVTSGAHHTHTANFALGQKAIELSAQSPSFTYNDVHLNNSLGSSLQQQQNPVEIYLLQQQYAEPSNQVLQQVPYEINNLQLTSTDLYPHSIQNPFFYDIILDNTKYNNNIDTKQETTRQNYEALQTAADTYVRNENTPIVQVFKDHNCLKDDNASNTQENNLQKPVTISAETPKYKERDLNGDFGARKINKHVKYPAYQFDSRTNARTERIYYSTEISPSTTLKNIAINKDEGISRLVASTQDLISNDDLLRINYAAEKISGISNDDFLRPQRRLKNISDKRERSRFIVSAKFGSPTTADGQSENEQRVRTNINEYKFTSPIVVEDLNNNNFKEDIVKNLVSTMVPYIDDGYEIIGVRNTFGDNSTKYGSGVYENSNENLVAITPRPIGQNYLAPITVALRLFNSNSSNNFNSVEDHEASDSELIASSIENPHKQQVIVEIQESIPVGITHINEVEYHEYLDEGQSNTESPLGLVKSLYQKYIASLDNNNNQNDNNSIGNSKFGTNLNNDYDNDEKDNGSKEIIEPSENIQNEVHVQANIDKSNGYNDYYENGSKDKLIQPIVIEKQVPITTYVDRFIEKQVPYPEPYEVVKHVPVDRPVPVPVHYERIVEKPVEVTRYVDKPYPVEVLQPFPVEVRVPYPVEHKVYVDRPVHVPYPVEKIIEKQMIHPVPIPTPVAIPVGIQVPVEKKVLYPVGIETPVAVPVPYEKQVPVEKVIEREVPVPYAVEKKVPYPVHHEVKVPVPYPVEKRVPFTVEKIVEKPVTITKFVEKPVHIKVSQPVPVEVHVPKPYPVDRIVEKKVPYPVHVEHVVERKVPVQVPYPVKTVVEKFVDKPVYLTKYIDRPYPVERRVPYPVEKIVERKVPYPVEVPYEVRVPYPSEKQVKKPDPHPYTFEKVDPSLYLYSYGNQAYPYQLQNLAKPTVHENRNSAHNNYQHRGNQQQAESQKNYQIQLINANILKNMQNVPVQSTLWGNQYASNFQYVNTTSNHKPYFTPHSTQFVSQKYIGPTPPRSNNDHWSNNEDYNDRRKSDRSPKVANLRIEYGFKPPLIPSTEVDLDGQPVNKGHE